MVAEMVDRTHWCLQDTASAVDIILQGAFCHRSLLLLSCFWHIVLAQCIQDAASVVDITLQGAFCHSL